MSLKTRAFALGLAVASLSTPLARAADHLDVSTTPADLSTDIADLYAWMDSGAQVVNLAMTVFPNADKNSSKFSNTALYVFHIVSKQSITDTTTPAETTVVCSFNTAPAQIIQCWAGDTEYVTGNAAAATLVSQSGKMKVFAGPRNDPFFFNLSGFNNAVTTVKPLLTNATRDTTNGCPSNLTTVMMKPLLSTGTDTFVGQNVLAIVVSLDKSLLTTGQRQTLTVYASTNKPVQ